MTDTMIELDGVSKRFEKKLDIAEKIFNMIGGDLQEEIVHAVDAVDMQVKDGEVVGITGSLSELEEFDEAIAEQRVNKAFIEHVEKHRRYPKPEELVEAKRKQKEKLARMGKRRYMKMRKDLFSAADSGVTVAVTNEEIDKTTIVSKLQELLVLAVNNQDLALDKQGIVDTMMDMMGLPADRLYGSPINQMSPIDKFKKQVEDQQAIQQAREAVQQTKRPDQQMNALTGRTAPQQKFGPDTPRGVSKDTTTRTADNQTLIPA